MCKLLLYNICILLLNLRPRMKIAKQKKCLLCWILKKALKRKLNIPNLSLLLKVRAYIYLYKSVCMFTYLLILT